jgi:hypothetical protein
MTVSMHHTRRPSRGLQAEHALIGLIVVLAAAVALLVGRVATTDGSGSSATDPTVALARSDPGLALVLSADYPVDLVPSRATDDGVPTDPVGEALGTILASPFGPVPRTEVGHPLGYLFSERFPGEIVEAYATGDGS